MRYVNNGNINIDNFKININVAIINTMLVKKYILLFNHYYLHSLPSRYTDSVHIGLYTLTHYTW